MLVSLIVFGGANSYAANVSPSAMVVSEDKAQHMIEEPQADIKKAASVDGLWRDTDKLLKQAQEALQNKQFEQSMELASKARKEAQLGYQQSVSQKELKLPNYLTQ